MSTPTTTPTQVARPWTATARTALQVGVPALIALGVVVPQIVQIILEESGDAMPEGLRVALLAAAAAVTALAAILTRVMALPQVELLLRRYVPALAADRDLDGDGVPDRPGDHRA